MLSTRSLTRVMRLDSQLCVLGLRFKFQWGFFFEGLSGMVLRPMNAEHLRESTTIARAKSSVSLVDV